MKKWTLPVVDEEQATENFIFLLLEDENRAPGMLLFPLDWKPSCTVKLEDLTPKELQPLQ